MKNVMIFLVSVAALVVAWRYIARHFRGKGHGKTISHLAGAAVGLVSSVVVIIALAPSPEKAPATAAAIAPATVSPPSATPIATPAPAVAAAPAGPTLGMSADQILKNLSVIERTVSPLADGTRREMAKVSKLLTVEMMGSPADVSRYTVMFALPSDDATAAVETGLYAAQVLANTFPSWRGDQNNPVKWLGDSSIKLTKQSKKKPDESASVKLVRDGKKVEYKLVPVLGLLFLVVEPA